MSDHKNHPAEYDAEEEFLRGLKRQEERERLEANERCEAVERVVERPKTSWGMDPARRPMSDKIDELQKQLDAAKATRTLGRSAVWNTPKGIGIGVGRGSSELDASDARGLCEWLILNGYLPRSGERIEIRIDGTVVVDSEHGNRPARKPF